MDTAMLADFQVEDHGTIFLVRPQTNEATDFVDLLTDEQPETMTYGGAVALDHRLAGDFLAQLLDDGYTVAFRLERGRKVLR